MWDVCIEILNDLSQAPGDDITTLNGKCSFPLAAAGVTADQPWSRARGVLLQIPGRTFCFCGTNGVGMSAYWWWLWRLRGDSVSSLRALCAWTREYVVINFFFKLLLFFYFFKFNQNNPNMSPENGRTLSSGETKQTCWLLACCVGSFATVKCSKPWCIMKKPEMRIHHQPHNDDSPWFIYYLWPWNLVPWASRLWTWPGQIFAAPPSVACGDVTLCFVINQRFLVNILNSLSEF